MDEYTFDEKEEDELEENEDEENEEEEKQIKVQRKHINDGYVLPPFSLLATPPQKEADSGDWIQKQIQVLNRTFEEFGVGAAVYRYTKGPTVTRYEIALDRGVNVNKITSISDNLKMALAAKEIRIEAPIPGKTTVGIEVPNLKPEMVYFLSIVDTEEFKNVNPTAENIARVCYHIIRPKIDASLDLKIYLYETERNYVEFPA